MDELVLLIQQLNLRIEALERLIENREIVIPSNGKLVVDNRASDPTGTTGRLYYSSTSGKFRVYASGLWRDVDTTP
jgi:hypothetical protein